jgi:WD40 repeat protein
VTRAEIITYPLSESGNQNRTATNPCEAQALSYSALPKDDGKMIATGGYSLEIWDANSGKLLETFEHLCLCLAWSMDGKTLMAGRSKIDTATWTVLHMGKNYPDTNSLSPNGRVLATTHYFDKTVQLWDLQTNRIPPGFFDNALREANVGDLHLLSNVLTNMLSVAYSSLRIP